jgi:hypothetical protein
VGALLLVLLLLAANLPGLLVRLPLPRSVTVCWSARDHPPAGHAGHIEMAVCNNLVPCTGSRLPFFGYAARAADQMAEMGFFSGFQTIEGDLHEIPGYCGGNAGHFHPRWVLRGCFGSAWPTLNSSSWAPRGNGDKCWCPRPDLISGRLLTPACAAAQRRDDRQNFKTGQECAHRHGGEQAHLPPVQARCGCGHGRYVCYPVLAAAASGASTRGARVQRVPGVTTKSCGEGGQCSVGFPRAGSTISSGQSPGHRLAVRTDL